jgi:hypothetical protein
MTLVYKFGRGRGRGKCWGRDARSSLAVAAAIERHGAAVLLTGFDKEARQQPVHVRKARGEGREHSSSRNTDERRARAELYL